MIIEVNKPEDTTPPKYNVDDEVWLLCSDVRGFIEARVNAVIPCRDTYKYELSFDCYDVPDNIPTKIELEWDLFPSREALIDAQIEYWSSLKKEEKSTDSDDVSISASLQDSVKVCKHAKDAHSDFVVMYPCKYCGGLCR